MPLKIRKSCLFRVIRITILAQVSASVVLPYVFACNAAAERPLPFIFLAITFYCEATISQINSIFRSPKHSSIFYCYAQMLHKFDIIISSAYNQIIINAFVMLYAKTREVYFLSTRCECVSPSFVKFGQF